MEKTQEEKPNQTLQFHNPKSLVWDCESSLYDSFELKSFERQLGSAIASRTLSMPHLPDRQPHLPPPGPPPKPVSKKPSKFSRSFHKLLKSIFGPKQNISSLFNLKGSQDEFYVAYSSSGSLSTIPEVPETVAEYGGVSPDFNKSLAKMRSASDRFTATSTGISCA